jgi:hypothetical protein
MPAVWQNVAVNSSYLASAKRSLASCRIVRKDRRTKFAKALLKEEENQFRVEAA